jgi:hypothetical protein
VEQGSHFAQILLVVHSLNFLEGGILQLQVDCSLLQHSQVRLVEEGMLLPEEEDMLLPEEEDMLLLVVVGSFVLVDSLLLTLKILLEVDLLVQVGSLHLQF